MKTKIQKIQTALTQIQNPNLSVYHYFSPSRKQLPYAVWYEEGENTSLETGNHKSEQAVQGFVHYFTQTEFDPMFDSIQEALNGIENCTWDYDSTAYGDPAGDNNNVIHHMWTWRVF